MLYLGQRRSYFSAVNRVLLTKVIFRHYERYTFVCYFLLQLITIFSPYSLISLQAKLKGRQNTPMPGVMQSQRQVRSPCPTFLYDQGAQPLPLSLPFKCLIPLQRSFWAMFQKCMALSLWLPYCPTTNMIQLGLSCFLGVLGLNETSPQILQPRGSASN